MKKLVSTLLIIILSLAAMAQVNDLSRSLKGSNSSNNGDPNSFGDQNFGNGNQPGGNKENKPMTAADSARLLIKPKMILWTWEHNGVYKNISQRDTSIDYSHVYNPNFRKSISYTYTGNVVSAHLSNIFVDRQSRTDYQFLKVYDAYLTRGEDFSLINTTTPFTSISFKTGGSKQSGDTYFRVIHTQNINPFLNAGINYNYLIGNGKYMHNKSKVYDVNFFANYEKKRVAANFFINNNIGSFEENGGIDDPKNIRDTTISSENIPVKMMYPETDFYNKNIKFAAQYNIGSSQKIITAKDTTTYYPLKITYAFRSEDNFRKFTEKTLSDKYFAHNYLSDTETYDRDEYTNYTNAFNFVWNEKKGSIKPGMYVGVSRSSGEYKFYSEQANIDKTLKSSYSQETSKYNTDYLEGGIFKKDSAKINFDFNARLAFRGTYSDEQYLNANVDFNLSKNNLFAFEGHYSNIAPNHNMQYFFSNHYKWSNNFDYEKNIQFKAAYINKAANLEIAAIANSITNYTQFGFDALPIQEKSRINIYTAYINHNLKLWRFHFLNKIYYQKSSSANVDLPKFCFFASYYLKTYIFNNALLLKFGADLTYNTNFYAPSYNMATNSFYRQNKEMFGKYPKIDLVADLKIKRMTIFIKYEHLTYHFGNKNYFLNAYNAMDPAMLKYGFTWIFND